MRTFSTFSLRAKLMVIVMIMGMIVIMGIAILLYSIFQRSSERWLR